MNVRTTNLAILALLSLELASGLGSFLVGRPDWQWVFWLHAAGGFSLVATTNTTHCYGANHRK